MFHRIGPFGMNAKKERMATHTVNDYLDIIEDLYIKLAPKRPDWEFTPAELAENIRAGVRDHLVSKEMLDVLAVSLHNKLTELMTEL